MYTRERAWELLSSLRSTYSIAALLHDFDYDRHPSLDEHPFVGNKVLTEQGWPEEIRHAILAHASYTGAARESHLDRALFACDELAGVMNDGTARDVSLDLSSLQAKTLKVYGDGTSPKELTVGDSTSGSLHLEAGGGALLVMQTR